MRPVTVRPAAVAAAVLAVGPMGISSLGTGTAAIAVALRTACAISPAGAVLRVKAAAGAVIYFFCMAFRGPAYDTFSRTFFVVFHNTLLIDRLTSVI
jgi:hypothetical protein